MGTTPSKSKYTHSNLVIEYHFNLKTPSSHPRVLEINGASLYEFHPDEQDNILSDLKYIISDGDEKTANIYNKYRRINNFIKFFIFLVLISYISYIVVLIMCYLQSLEILSFLICTSIFIISTSSAIYCLFFTSKAKLKSLLRWRQSIITKISRKTSEWQTKSKPFAFTIYYPINHIKYGRKNKIVNVRGILRITLGMPKFKSRREPVYFQATPRKKAIRMHSESVISKNNAVVGLEMSQIKNNQKRFMSLKEWNKYNDNNKVADDSDDENENVGNNNKRNWIELAIEIDDDGNVQNVPSPLPEKEENEEKQDMILPIIINGDNGPQILLQGIKTIINGQEVILIDKPQKSVNNYPISPVQPDLSFNNDIVLSISDNTFTGIQSEL